MIYINIWSYDKASYGVRVLYTLAETLNRNGVAAKIVCQEKYSSETEAKIPLRYKGIVLYENHDFGPQDVGPQDIVVYPDVIQGNPLGAQRVVRYLLNRPYYLMNYGIDYGPTDYLMAYSKTVDANLPPLFLLNDDSAVFCPDPHVEREDQVAIYLGKVNKKLLVSRVRELERIVASYKKVVVLNRLFPTSRLELVNIVRRSKLLVCLDPLTNLSYEATLCGTPCLVFDDSFSTTSGTFGVPLYGVMNNIAQWDEAVREVPLAFTTYVNALNDQATSAVHVFESITAHFRKIEDPVEDAYRERNRLLVAVQKELDQARARLKLGSEQLGNIFRLSDIPKPVRKVLLAKASPWELQLLKEAEVEKFHPKPWPIMVIGDLVMRAKRKTKTIAQRFLK